MSNRACEQELLTAVEEADVEAVTELLQQGVDVNFGWFQNTPLHEAGKRGHVGVAELLLKAGAQVDSKDGLENTPLHNAALGGHVGVAELLFTIGAQVDSRDRVRFGNSPLHCAASGGHVGVAELLLKAGAQVDIRNEFGNTPLHKSAEEGVVGVAELLLKAGAQVDSRGDFENTPLHYATEGGHVGVAKLLLKHGAQVVSRNKMSREAEGDFEGVEKYFHSTKEEVSTGWMDLSFHLGFKGNDIANIAGRNRDDKSRCMDMLQEWKKKKGDAATKEVLMEALSEAELQSVVDGLKNKFPDIVIPKQGEKE
ncbi:PREDICTED: ankyrin repeat and protein kinase domain-containing protein 1-like [Branchiostoma belcheri]|uniref:Ankyrin repeat and protein kinase domain-containing protein 1-like n=1 Tax=Branchiostoma belcheri TaxID=7741 RepID=A0A6P4YKJ8_BRABE|nr:PREDICTED: ankyrin repeat and protein kinase domain-containing protein 1-like [Branchiostoma belcheri]